MGDRRLLGELLVDAGLVRRDELDLALQEQKVRGGRLCYQVMRLGKGTPGSLFVFLQDHFGIIAPDLLEILRGNGRASHEQHQAQKRGQYGERATHGSPPPRLNGNLCPP